MKPPAKKPEVKVRSRRGVVTIKTTFHFDDPHAMLKFVERNPGGAGYMIDGRGRYTVTTRL
jgi:hypothetical protein